MGSTWDGNQAKALRIGLPLDSWFARLAQPHPITQANILRSQQLQGEAPTPSSESCRGKENQLVAHARSITFSIYPVPDSGSTQRNKKSSFETFICSLSHQRLAMTSLPSLTQASSSSRYKLPPSPSPKWLSFPTSQSSSTCPSVPSTPCEMERVFPDSISQQPQAHAPLTKLQVS